MLIERDYLRACASDLQHQLDAERAAHRRDNRRRAWIIVALSLAGALLATMARAGEHVIPLLPGESFTMGDLKIVALPGPAQPTPPTTQPYAPPLLKAEQMADRVRLRIDHPAPTAIVVWVRSKEHSAKVGAIKRGETFVDFTADTSTAVPLKNGWELWFWSVVDDKAGVETPHSVKMSGADPPANPPPATQPSARYDPLPGSIIPKTPAAARDAILANARGNKTPIFVADLDMRGVKIETGDGVIDNLTITRCQLGATDGWFLRSVKGIRNSRIGFNTVTSKPGGGSNGWYFGLGGGLATGTVFEGNTLGTEKEPLNHAGLLQVDGGSHNVVFRNNVIHASRAGLEVQCGPTPTNWIFENNEVYAYKKQNEPFAGVSWAFGESDRCIIRNNKIINHDGQVPLGLEYMGTNGLVENNTIVGFREAIALAHNKNGTIVRGNWLIDQVGGPVVWLTGVSKGGAVSFVDNVIENGKGADIFWFHGGAKQEGSVFTGNKLRISKSCELFRVNEASGVKFENNWIERR